MTDTKLKKKYTRILYKILCIVLPITVILIGAACTVVYIIISNTNEENISKTSQEIVSANAKIVTEKLMSIVTQCKTLADNSLLNTFPPDKQIKELEKITEQEPLYSFGTILSPQRHLYITGHDSAVIVETDNFFYQEMILKQKDFLITPPHFSRVTNSHVVYVCTPVRNKHGENISILSVAVNSDSIGSIISNISVSNLGHGYLLKQEDTLIEPGRINIGYHIKDADEGFTQCTTEKGEELSIFWQSIANTTWKLAVVVPTDQLKAKQYYIRTLFLTLVPLACALFIATVFFMLNKLISRPLKDILQVAKEVSYGRLYAASKLDTQNNDELGILSNHLKTMADKIDSTTSMLKDESLQINESGTEINTVADTIFNGAIKQRQSVEDVSATVEEMITSISQNAENAATAKRSSDEIAENIAIVSQASDQSLRSNKKIAEKTKIVKEIASRTDILAINAAVEASRAGENGMGFAVVATEIRKLAEKSRAASVEIDTACKENIKFTSTVTTMLDQLSKEIRQNRDMVSEIAYACEEQRNGTDTITTSILQLSDISKENTTIATSLTSRAKKLAEYAKHLTKSMEFFQTSGSAENIKNAEILAEIKKHADAIMSLNDKYQIIKQNIDKYGVTQGQEPQNNNGSESDRQNDTTQNI